MKASSITELKKELKNRPQEELVDICLSLAKFKKESKELLTYILFESSDEKSYVRNIKEEIDEQFEQINTERYYILKKNIRKILRNVKKYIRYSKNKESEVELLLYYCFKLKSMRPSIFRSQVLKNIYEREIISIRKKIESLHEDLQYDYAEELADY